MQNSPTTIKNNFSTAKTLSIALIGILVFGALASIPFGVSKFANIKMFEIKDLLDEHQISTEGGISIYGCDQSGTNGGISIFGCAKGGNGPNGGKGGIAIYGIASGGDGGADGTDGVQGNDGSAFGPNA